MYRLQSSPELSSVKPEPKVLTSHHPLQIDGDNTVSLLKKMIGLFRLLSLPGIAAGQLVALRPQNFSRLRNRLLLHDQINVCTLTQADIAIGYLCKCHPLKGIARMLWQLTHRQVTRVLLLERVQKHVRLIAPTKAS